MVNSLTRRGIEPEVDQFGEVPRNEQTNFSGGQTVVSHFSLVRQKRHDVGCGRPRCRRDIVHDFVLQPLKTGLFLGTFSSHGVSC